MGMLIDETWIDLNGREYQRYTVRNAESGFFMPLDTLRNMVLLAGGDRIFRTAEEGWDRLRNTDVADLDAHQRMIGQTIEKSRKVA